MSHLRPIMIYNAHGFTVIKLFLNTKQVFSLYIHVLHHSSLHANIYTYLHIRQKPSHFYGQCNTDFLLFFFFFTDN